MRWTHLPLSSIKPSYLVKELLFIRFLSRSTCFCLYPLNIIEAVRYTVYHDLYGNIIIDIYQYIIYIYIFISVYQYWTVLDHDILIYHQALMILVRHQLRRFLRPTNQSPAFRIAVCQMSRPTQACPIAKARRNSDSWCGWCWNFPIIYRWDGVLGSYLDSRLDDMNISWFSFGMHLDSHLG
jgi:hypothetical protein